MSKIINIRGDIITDDIAWIYDWLDEPYASPRLIDSQLTEAIDSGETDIIVRINSGGGLLNAGQEIYSLLHGLETTVEITGIAASAAALIAMGGKVVKMHPASMIMVHNVSGNFTGDYREMQHGAKVLQELNKSTAMAFVAKSSKSIEEVLALMDKESWITADKALEYGFADEIIGEDLQAAASWNGLSVTPEQIAQVKAEKALQDKAAAERAKIKSKLALELALMEVKT